MSCCVGRSNDVISLLEYKHIAPFESSHFVKATVVMRISVSFRVSFQNDILQLFALKGHFVRFFLLFEILFECTC